MLNSSAARGKVVMCDPVCEHRFRCGSCHTLYFILSMGDIGYWTIPPFVEPLLFANLAWRALSWCRRISVRPPDDIEKSVHRLHCATPLSGNFARSKLLESSLNLHFFQRGLRHLISREYRKQPAQVIRRTLAIIQWEFTTQGTSRQQC